MSTVQKLAPGVGLFFEGACMTCSKTTTDGVIIGGAHGDHPDTWICVTCFVRISKALKRFVATHD